MSIKSYFASILFLVCALSISAQNKGTGTSLVSRSFHDLTSHYNGYFNAKLTLNQAIKNASFSLSEDYSELLPLLTANTKEIQQSMEADANTAIEKASVAVKMHANSKWSDDCYFTIGRANFYKGDYKSALQAFQAITSKFDQGVREDLGPKRQKKVKKTEKRASKTGVNPYYDPLLSFAKHKPMRYEAMIWIVRCYAQLKQWSNAQRVISIIREDKAFPDQLTEDLEIAIADMYIQQKDYEKATESLAQAIRYAGNKKRKIRYTYTLGQLYQSLGDSDESFRQFKRLLSLNPDYKMEFHTRMRMAVVTAQSDPNQSRAYLKNLLRNDNYEEFYGDVYYTMAGLDKEAGKNKAAKENYSKALAAGMSIKSHQPEAYLNLGQIYFDEQNYVQSKAYHDSALSVLPKLDERYAEIELRKNTLGKVAEQLVIIQEQDSLQRIGKMTDDERLAYLEDLREQKRLAREAELEAKSATVSAFNDDNQGFTGVVDFPFYNDALRGSGFNAFKQEWGERKLEDHWRRSNKQSFSTLAAQGAGEENEEALTFSGYPKTPEEFVQSDKLIASAFYKLGQVYKDDLIDFPKAMDAFESYLTRFPAAKKKPEVLYSLYLMHQEEASGKEEKYKNLLLNEFPESLYAEIIRNPDYMEEQNDKLKDVDRYYATTYKMFGLDKHETVLDRIEDSKKRFKESHLAVKFLMLEAQTYAKMGKIAECRKALQTIVNKYKHDPMNGYAVSMLNALDGVKFINDDLTEADTSIYEFNEQAAHFFVVALHNKDKAKKAALKEGLNKLVKDEFAKAKLKVTELAFNTETVVISVQTFDGSAAAKAFYNKARYDKTIFGQLKEKDFDAFYMTKKNFGVFYREKDFDGYMSFFTKRFLNVEEKGK